MPSPIKPVLLLLYAFAKYFEPLVSLNTGTEDIGVSSSQIDDLPVTVTTSGANDAGELKV